MYHHLTCNERNGGHQTVTDACSFHQVMHDEVSETENIRKNLAIERMIIEGCDILLDVNQTFVRQGQSGCWLDVLCLSLDVRVCLCLSCVHVKQTFVRQGRSGCWLVVLCPSLDVRVCLCLSVFT